MDQSGFVERNVGWLGELLELGEVEREILRLVVYSKTSHMFGQVLDLMGRDLNNRDICLWVAAILRRDPKEIRAALASGSALTASGLMTMNAFRTHFEDKFEVNGELAGALVSEHESAHSFLRCFLKLAASTDLTLADYGHLADLQILLPYLEHSLRHRTLGVNILLHGPPGTGKTDLTGVLAHSLGATLYQVMDEDADGEAMSGESRLNAFWVYQKLLGQERQRLLLFDEVEDVFPSARSSRHAYGGQREQQKSRINRILETNPVPSFWVSNEVEQIDPAFLRRFDLVLEVGMLSKMATCYSWTRPIACSRTAPEPSIVGKSPRSTKCWCRWRISRGYSCAPPTSGRCWTWRPCAVLT
ncbi:MAG: ATP-binding protein [Magnetococcales bacterium]|nr:ATP-binding protein [Magnetococcales bacterium]